MGGPRRRREAVARGTGSSGATGTAHAGDSCAQEIEVLVDAPTGAVNPGEPVTVVRSAGEVMIVSQGAIHVAAVTGEWAEHIRRCMARGFRFEGTAHHADGGIRVVIHGYRAAEH